MRRTLVITTASLIAFVINLGLVGIVAWAMRFPSWAYGSSPPGNAVGSACLALVPVANLLALSLAFAGAAGRHALRFVRMVSWANRMGVALGVLFGLSSAPELSYSPIELAATLVLLIPPATTAVALWVANGGRGLPSVE